VVSDITLTLIGKPGCHLCEDAEAVVTTVVQSLPDLSIEVEDKSIEDDKDLFDSYWDQIPVLLINGKVHNYWRIDPERLTNALKELS
jgi:glutaredoxin